jgi:hypothetical protein
LRQYVTTTSSYRTLHGCQNFCLLGFLQGPDAGGAMYTLTGVVEHQGVMHNGHYIAYVQRGLDLRLESGPGDAELATPLTEGDMGVSGLGDVAAGGSKPLPLGRGADAETSATANGPPLQEARTRGTASQAGSDVVLGTANGPSFPWGAASESASLGKTGSTDQTGGAISEPEAPEAEGSEDTAAGKGRTPSKVSGPEDCRGPTAHEGNSPHREEGADWEALLEGEAPLIPNGASAPAKIGGTKAADHGKPEEDGAVRSPETAPDKGKGNAKGKNATKELGRGRDGGKQGAGADLAVLPNRDWGAARAVKSVDELAWYRVSDENVGRVTTKAVATCEAYILMYARV